MPIATFIACGLSLLPVLLFLCGLQLLDTFKLVSMRRVLRTMGIGCGMAVLCYALNAAILNATHMPLAAWARTGAPVLEEAAKALYVWYLIRTRRIGFMVDAAICGFAVGAGFALVENLVYVLGLPGVGLATYAVRGFGTAVMHGGATAIFGIVTINRALRQATAWRVPREGLGIAILIHLLYNQTLWPPPIAAAVFLLALPVILAFVFWRSEKGLEKWIGSKLDKDMDLLQMIATDTFAGSPAGLYLRSLEKTFPPQLLGDMLCYLHLSAELSARAKGALLLREMGFPVPADAELAGQLKELAFLEAGIGRAGKLALTPLVGAGHLEVWEIIQLSEG
jgi:RsiW-degrading membrane proteinase PrsW (M82 family)